MPAASSCRPPWKRATDVVVGVALLVALAIPMAIIALAILADSGRPVVMLQRRIGVGSREYRMWKFRTLPQDTPQLAKSNLAGIGGITPTPLGRFMRRYSLDELPQLLNVVVGDMSLIGPRPALYTQDDLVGMRQRAGVMCARPGLSGLAQVRGRELLTLEDKVALDAEYVRAMSPLADLRILVLTVVVVIRARGGY